MKKFIAYFDYLGFKEFIEKNEAEVQTRVMGQIFVEMEAALGQGKYKDAYNGVIADISNSKINCINFSDTVIFWTNDDSEESLKELLAVAHTFNWRAILFSFPVRGALLYEEIYHASYSQANGGGGVYNVNSVYGKGLVQGNVKAEQQDWAGTVIDDTLIAEISRRGHDVDKYLSPFSKKLKVPYKVGVEVAHEEYVFWIIKGTLDEKGYKNYRRTLEENFTNHKKTIAHPGVAKKIANTVKFLDSFKE